MPLAMDVFAILFAIAAVATNLWIGGGEGDFSMLLLLVGLLASLGNALTREVRILRERFGGAVLISVLMMW